MNLMKEKLDKDQEKVVEVIKNPEPKFGWKSWIAHALVFLWLNALVTVSENWEVINQFVQIHTTTWETILVAWLLSPFVKKLIEYGIKKLTSKLTLQWE